MKSTTQVLILGLLALNVANWMPKGELPAPCVSGCGSSSSSTSSGSPPPVTTTTAYNLERFAKIATDAKYQGILNPYSGYEVLRMTSRAGFIADGYIPRENVNAPYAYKTTTWMPNFSNYYQTILDGIYGDGDYVDITNNAYVDMAWSSPVSVSEIILFDVYVPQQQVTWGKLVFTPANAGDVIEDIYLDKALPDLVKIDSDNVRVLGPSKPIIAMKIVILNHVGESAAGLSEVNVIGKRIEERVSELSPAITNIAPYAKVDASSSQYSMTETGFTNAGMCGPINMKDGLNSKEWIRKK